MPDTIQHIFEKHGLDVSRETLEKLETYQRLLLKWQRVINLISATTIDDMATRHFYDSAQLLKYIPNKDAVLADMGSGAGFPGMVLAILGMKNVHLIESDILKATFLREVSRETSTPIVMHDDRVEECHLPPVDVFTARALAPLVDLLKYVRMVRHENHPCYALFLKGGQYQDELTKAHKKFKFSAETFQSDTDLTGKIIKISNLDSLPCNLK